VIVVIDYDMGNIRSVEKALAKIGAEFKVSNQKKDLEKATHIIIPGVGSFDKGMRNFEKLGLTEMLKKEVLEKKKPLLGICLGMQLLFKTSEEGVGVNGLGFIDGNIKHFKFEHNQQLKIPHTGWNDVFGEDILLMPLFKNIGPYSNFYFVHSYHAVLNEKVNCGYTNYGYNYVSVVQKENIYGVQFHPEKSQKKGLEILRNFAALPGAN